MNTAIPSPRLAIAIVLLAAPLAGCIGVDTNAARVFPTYPPESLASSQPTKLALTVTFTAHGSAANDEVRQMQDVKIKYRATELLNETGAVRVSMNPGEAGYRLALSVDDAGGGSFAPIANVLTAMTLYIIPSWMTHNYATTAELTAPSGKIVATKRHVHSMTLIRQFFLVVGMPSSSINKVHDRMWDAMLKDLSVWTAEQVKASSS